jgi:hypothetical protein
VQDFVYIRVLQRAADKVGADALAEHLGVPLKRLRSWQAGRAPVPAYIFLKVVDFLIGNSVGPNASRRDAPSAAGDDAAPQSRP